MTEFVVSLIVFALFCSTAACFYLAYQGRTKSVKGEEQELARAHRLIMRLADAYEMADTKEKCLVVRQLRSEVSQYKLDATRESVNFKETETSVVFSLRKISAISRPSSS